MTEDQYIKERLDDQIEWYDDRSQKNQRWFKRLQVVQIVAGASIPFLVGFLVHGLWVRVLVGVLGIIVATIAAVTGLYQFHEHWIQYRSTCEALRHEKHLYLTGTEPYHGDEKFALLVQRVESLISAENTHWSRYMTSASHRAVGRSDVRSGP